LAAPVVFCEDAKAKADITHMSARNWNVEVLMRGHKKGRKQHIQRSSTCLPFAGVLKKMVELCLGREGFQFDCAAHPSLVRVLLYQVIVLACLKERLDDTCAAQCASSAAAGLCTSQ
jgi:hypothetical protein